MQIISGGHKSQTDSQEQASQKSRNLLILGENDVYVERGSINLSILV